MGSTKAGNGASGKAAANGAAGKVSANGASGKVSPNGMSRKVASNGLAGKVMDVGRPIPSAPAIGVGRPIPTSPPNVGGQLSASGNASRERADAEVRAVTDELAARVLELAQANKELETFSFTVSHDLRTPLTIIENYVHVLLKKHGAHADPEATKAMEGIHAAVQRMSLLIENILRLSRVSRLPVSRQRIDLAEIARSVLAELAERDPTRKVTIVVPGPIWADADPAITRIVVANLLGNAWKFTAKLPVARIEFGEDTRHGAGSYFVKDNGPGFDMQDANRLFKLFERLHSPGEFAGTGIGLATVARAVQRHEGTAWAEGAPGKGATFFFTLGPAAVAAPPGLRKPAREKERT